MLEIKKIFDPNKVVILSINVINVKGQARAEVKRYKMDYTVLSGRGKKITSHYKVKKLPHLFIIDKNGVIRSSKRFLPGNDIKKVLNNLLNETKNEEQKGN